MTDAGRSSGNPFHLARFTSAQEGVYARALSELRDGQKRGHWMWYVFPQIDGLGYSATTRYYSIKSREEACAYLAHPVLGPRLVECAKAVLALEGRSATQVFGYPDDAKLRSCMTLFAAVADPGSVFSHVLEKFLGGRADDETLRRLAGG